MSNTYPIPRPGPGRPPIPDEDKLVPFSMRLPAEDAAKLRRIGRKRLSQWLAKVKEPQQ